MAIALRHLLVLRITRFFSKILAFNRWIKCYSGPPASLILGVNLLFFLGERKLIEKKYCNSSKVELALCDVLITHEGKTGGKPGPPQLTRCLVQRRLDLLPNRPHFFVEGAGANSERQLLGYSRLRPHPADFS